MELKQGHFVERLRKRGMDDPTGFKVATASLLRAYDRFRNEASQHLGLTVRTGVPIGSLTSRVVANVSLATLDERIESNPGVVAYRRYVDDLVVVANATPVVTTDAVLGALLPLAESTDQTFRLDVNALERPGCEFALQRRKTKMHHLAGDPGEDFVEAVLADFDRLVSRSQAFLDTATLLDDGATHLIRASDGEGSPLRVLRDADRTHLERFALSTSMRTLERATVLLDAEDAKRVVRATLERVGRILSAEDDWVENLDTALRLLRLAVGTRDWRSCKQLHGGFERVFGSVATLKANIGALRYRGETIDPARSRPWIWLRNFLHARRLESIASAVPRDLSARDLSAWAPSGVTMRTGTVGAVVLRRRAKELALADLRTHDREDDLPTLDREADDTPPGWMEGVLPELATRFDDIRLFVEACVSLRDRAWVVPVARLFLATRPPSYFDVARRLLYRGEGPDGFAADVFDRLLNVVNAIRGTRYQDTIGRVRDPHTVDVPWLAADPEGGRDSATDQDPVLVLGNLVLLDTWWERAAARTPAHPHGRPVHTVGRLLGLKSVIDRAVLVTRPNRTTSRPGPPTLLVLPELSVPRRWFRFVAHYVVRHGGFGAVMGLEYLHDPSGPYVVNQAFAVLPGPFGSVATWPWTKQWPADGEGRNLAAMRPPLALKPVTRAAPRIVVQTTWGRFSTLICSELIEARRVADLLGRAELVLVPAWNPDTSSYDHLVQSVGFQLHAIIAIANNGHYSDCRAWAPRHVRWQRDLCRLIQRDVNDVVHVRLPLDSLIAFHRGRAGTPDKPDWRPLPPDWPSVGAEHP